MCIGRCPDVYVEMSQGVWGDVLRCIGRCPRVYVEMSQGVWGDVLRKQIHDPSYAVFFLVILDKCLMSQSSIR